MDFWKSVTSGHSIFAWITVLTGSILFLWFLWPLLFKGMINTGNICGMLFSAVLVLYGIFYRAVHQKAAFWWQYQPARDGILVLAFFFLAGMVLAAAAAAAITGAASSTIPENTPAVVLGCSVRGTRPSRVLQERIDAAFAYLQEHPDAVCILSGGKGQGEDISEAACMYRELVKAGIAPERLYQEDRSVNTKENLENSRKILNNLGLSESVTVISSEFHLYRGRSWAEKLGLESYGYAAHTDWKYFPTYFVREIAAVAYLWLF